MGDSWQHFVSSAEARDSVAHDALRSDLTKHTLVERGTVLRPCLGYWILFFFLPVCRGECCTLAGFSVYLLFFGLTMDGPLRVYFNWPMKIILRENSVTDSAQRCHTEIRDWLKSYRN